MKSDTRQSDPDSGKRYSFNRMEFSGSLGDLGTLLPISIGMILINGLNPTGLFISIGLYFILSGHYYGVTVPVQPMKVVGAYAIAMGITAQQIAASGLLIGVFLIVIGGSGAISWVGSFIPKPVIRGVQVSTGTLLMIQGVKFMIGISSFQTLQGAAEPYLNIQSIGMVPIGIILGALAGLITLFFLENKKIPAGILVILFGTLTGLIFGNSGNFSTFKAGLFFPDILPYGFPSGADFSFALLVLVLPQIPMTIGNAIIANADLSRQYFGKKSDKVTYRSLCYSMGFANILTFLIGGMPLCHGAGGLASHYRFGARTAGSNLMIGVIFVLLALFLGPHAIDLMNLLPYSVLGVLLVFSGSQLTLTMKDMDTRKDLFVCFMMLGITLASNLAVGFITGIVIAYMLKSDKLSV